MLRRLRLSRTPAIFAAALLAGLTMALTERRATATDQGGGDRQQGMRHGGGMHDPTGQDDMRVFHQLLDNGARIRRQVTIRADGVESLTESDDPAIAKALQSHVDSMSARVTQARPIHQRDPLFREVFRHASQITMTYALTTQGVKVTETSTDPYVVKLIQAHADVVSKFMANGRPEAMKNHAVPAP
jgi:hypothetical protein